uniref:Uncharacterized protein n=1 Tax=Nelumbo nucifera TaxID=4432 RepID=A0A822ZG96_NELNU|nr:TPA_asm: hypothetical protein HUJ06_000709 [Nelumbo nucifera]
MYYKKIQDYMDDGYILFPTTIIILLEITKYRIINHEHPLFSVSNCSE